MYRMMYKTRCCAINTFAVYVQKEICVNILKMIMSKVSSPLDRYVRQRVPSNQKLHGIAANEARSVAEQMVQKIVPRNTLSFVVHLAEHCNLNCRGCDNFSPIAKKEFLDVNEYERDCKKLSELFDGKASTIELLGGEPLLCPNITEVMRITRECFPHTEPFGNVYGGIRIVTNGLLLPKMESGFWDALRKYDIGICPTKYPVPCDYDAAEKKAKEEGAKYVYYNPLEPVKTLFKHTLDLTGSQDAMHSFLNCHRANGCIMLAHGRLFTCTVAANAHHLKDYFNLDIKLSAEDSIDIYSHTAREIMEFLARPIPFCRYCNIDKEKYGLPYGPSSKSIDEWT